jgi:allantoate deiminase
MSSTIRNWNEVAGQTAMQRADALATFSEEPNGLTRRFATPALREAGEQVRQWMQAAGMTTWRDAIGNVWGRTEGTGPGTLILGSHLDTVRGAGRYDGMLGVLVAIACVERLGPLPFSIEIAGFADEEGVRYGTAYLGSGVVAGRFDASALERRDADDVSMADAIRTFGGDPDGLADARRSGEDVLGYVEVHIEQGPVLEAQDVPVGVVTAIAGQTRAEVVFEGEAGHAGTVPMDLRRDALTAAAEWILTVENFGRGTHGLVATVGETAVEPGAGNVIPGRVTLSLDVRHADDGIRDAARERLLTGAVAIARRRGVEASASVVQETAAVVCDPALTDALAAAAGGDVPRLPSGAGHDAAVMSYLAPVAMLFVRCKGGISHNPAESVTAADVATAIDVTTRFLKALAA